MRAFLKHHIAPHLNDTLFAYAAYFWQFGKIPNLRNPKTFNEYLRHLILYEENALRNVAADKLAARNYVAEKIGPGILTEVYDVWDDPAVIDFAGLPSAFVLKANHGSQMVRVVTDKHAEDMEDIRSLVHDWISTNYYLEERERCYRDIRPKIFTEQFLNDSIHGVPPDYKFFVFDGRVELVQVDKDRFGDRKQNAYDRNFERLPGKLYFDTYPEDLYPQNFHDMICIAEKLGEDFSFIRVDLYSVDGQVYFGELTNFPMGGLAAIGSEIDKFLRSFIP